MSDSASAETTVLYKRLIVLLLIFSSCLAISLLMLIMRPAPQTGIRQADSVDLVQTAADIAMADDARTALVSKQADPVPLPAPQALAYTPFPHAPHVDVTEPELPAVKTAPAPKEITDSATETPQPAPVKAAPKIVRQPVDWTTQNMVPDMPLWRKNAIPFTPASGKPMIVIIIDDMGVNYSGSQKTVDLPAPLTLSYLPYAQNLRDQTAAARAKGHELMLHQPMQPFRETANPGPNVLKTDLPDSENLNRFMIGLDSFEGFVGVNNHMGSRFTSDVEALAPIVRETARRGLLFLDSKTAPEASGDRLAAKYGLPALKRDVFLDHYEGLEDVQKALRQMEHVAHQQGYAIAIGHPKSATIQALKTWLPSLDAKGLQLAPVSAVAKALAPAVKTGD